MTVSLIRYLAVNLGGGYAIDWIFLGEQNLERSLLGGKLPLPSSLTYSTQNPETLPGV
ncbi:hypothetical protein [Limnospira sp. PMC 1042.18]|uniref:hypothetical protein n=1 Tax=Limnospira sp. PMC 1042.18 TaxID=2981018 RepID=UPI0028E1784E|nr:hypothetical protein [Limnospira sp. PMC 1042.18]MDT9200680.1 hypothetical protein [Limnospira sp. PMC 1042.18]